ncbi:hypothetical protein ABKV19_008244 [Rosa sericea]
MFIHLRIRSGPSLSKNNSHSLPPESSSALHFSRINPLLGSLLPNYIVVGGVPDSDSWQLGPSLPLANPDNPNIIERFQVPGINFVFNFTI